MDYFIRLKELKKALKLTTEQLANEIDIPARTLGSYERGESKIPLDLLTKLCKKYSINPAWFSMGQGEIFISTCENTLIKCDNDALVKNLDTFYKRFNQIQKENGLNDFQFSKETGISESRIEKLGIGKVTPTLEELTALKSRFDVSIDWLLFDSTPCQNKQNNNDSLSPEEINILKKMAQKFNP